MTFPRLRGLRNQSTARLSRRGEHLPSETELAADFDRGLRWLLAGIAAADVTG
ncbi:MAG: hypothetical protein ABIP03_00795 [Aquihabitans sp.]